MEKLSHFLKTIHAPYIRKIRTFIMRTIHNRESYLASLSIKPISTKYGFDRGQPIDRVYIEKFLRNKQERIKGVCLEVVDGTYTKKFGGTKVTKSDVIDIFKSQKANIMGIYEISMELSQIIPTTPLFLPKHSILSMITSLQFVSAKEY